MLKDKFSESINTGQKERSRRANSVVPATHLNNVQHMGRHGRCPKLNHFCLVCKISEDRKGTVHEVEQNIVTDKETNIVKYHSL